MVTLLADYIARHNLRPGEFAARAGLNASSVSLWMHAKRRPGLVYAKAIETATNGEVPSDYWLSVKAENNNGRKRQKRVSRG
jgi:transcriptional regulator with XRE-family HTH domain